MRTLALLVFGVVLLACTEDAPTAADSSWARMSIVGAADGAFTGTAKFSPGSATSRRGPLSFGVDIRAPDAEVEYVFFWSEAGLILPTPGTYALTHRDMQEPQAFAGSLLGAWQGQKAYFDVVSGELTVVSASESVVEGMFELTAVVRELHDPNQELGPIDPDDPSNRVMVIGEFRAVPASTEAEQLPLAQ